MLLHLFHQQNFWLNEVWFFTPFIQFLLFDFLIVIFFSALLRKWLPFTGTWFSFRVWTRNPGNSPGQGRLCQERGRQPRGRGQCPPLQPTHAAPVPGSRCGVPSYHPAVGIQTASATGSELTCFVNLALETWSSKSRNSFSVDSSGVNSETKFTHTLISIWKVHFAVFSQSRYQVSGKTNFKGKLEQIKIPSKKSNWQKLFRHYKTKEETFANPIFQLYFF